jgi:hypothetical protein
MFENRRVYLLTGVAYMGAMLFGSSAIYKSTKHYRFEMLTRSSRF